MFPSNKQPIAFKKSELGGNSYDTNVFVIQAVFLYFTVDNPIFLQGRFTFLNIFFYGIFPNFFIPETADEIEKEVVLWNYERFHQKICLKQKLKRPVVV